MSPDLDYFEMVKEARRLRSSPGARNLRVAVLGDAATQYLITLLRVLLARASIEAHFYEAPFDTVETEALDPSSRLYASNPDAVVLLSSLGAFRRRYYASSGDRADLARSTCERLVGVWDALRRRMSGPILQAGLVLPVERLYGHYDHRVPGSLHTVASELNGRLKGASAEHASVFFVDLDHVASLVGKLQFLDERLWTLAKQPCALEHLPAVAKAIADVLLASFGRQIKCVVVDLDNTIWGGVLGDDGLDGIRIGEGGDGEAFEAFQLFLRELARRGILLAVCSKNDQSVAVRAFREHASMVLKESDIAVFVANWDSKADNIRLIRERLDISYDAMVFLDDSPFERNLVRELLPEVLVPEMPDDPSDFVKVLGALNLFETSAHSALDADRAALYRVEAQRREERQRFETVGDYLASLDMQLAIRRFDRPNLRRVAQLLQRSNQFNLATRRFSEADAERFMADEGGYIPLHASLRDRFADLGLISVVVLRVERPRLVIEEYVMSCRALQRGVEDRMMNRIFQIAGERGLSEVVGHYRPTGKNQMVEGFFARFGFTNTGGDGAGETIWALDTARYQPRVVDHIADV